MDIGYVWDDDTETYWVYDEEGGEETVYNDWPEEEEKLNKEVDMSALFMEWTVNCITEDYTTDDNNQHDPFSLPELITTGQGEETLATTAPENCNQHENEESTDNKEQAKENKEEITVNSLCDGDINWQVKDKLMMDSGAGVCVCPLAYAEECPLIPVTEEEKPPLRNVSGGRVTCMGRER